MASALGDAGRKRILKATCQRRPSTVCQTLIRDRMRHTEEWDSKMLVLSHKYLAVQYTRSNVTRLVRQNAVFSTRTWEIIMPFSIHNRLVDDEGHFDEDAVDRSSASCCGCFRRRRTRAICVRGIRLDLTELRHTPFIVWVNCEQPKGGQNPRVPKKLCATVKRDRIEPRPSWKNRSRDLLPGKRKVWSGSR